MTEQQIKEKTDGEKAQIARDADALANRPVKSTLDIVREKMAELKKGTAGVSQGAEKSAVVKGEPKAEGREPDGKFAKSEETKAKEKVSSEERALNALRRARVSSTILEKLSDEDRLQMGLDLAEQQSEVDRKLSEKGGKKESRQAEPDKGTPQEKADHLPKVNAKPLAEALLLDEDGLEGLDTYGRSLVEPLVERLSASQRMNESLAESLDAMALDGAMTRLRDRFPELSVAETWAEVKATAERMADSEDVDDDGLDVVSAYARIAEDAVWRVCRDSIKARRGATEAANSAAKSLGQPAVGARHGDMPLSKPANTLERITLAKQLMSQGMSAGQAEAEIKRRMQS
jgi:hypothetical protein